MRMMFIVIIWALAAFMPVQSTKVSIGRHCGGAFACLIPFNCIDSSTTIVESTVMEIKSETNKIDDDCPAIIRFHAYSKHKIYVSIESLDNTNSIIFTQTRSGSLQPISEFSCVKVGEIFQAKFNNADKKNDAPLPQTKLKCEFEVKVDENSNEIFDKPTVNDHVTIKIVSQITKETVIKLDFEHCDPTRLYFQPEVNKNKIYMPVEVGPGYYNCPKFYQMQYVPDKSDGYVDVENKLECNNKKFNVNGKHIPGNDNDDDDFKIRCVADATFYCDFDVKITPGKILVNKKSDKLASPPTPSVLECPSDFPHLIIENTPIRNPEFTCIYLGKKFVWSIKHFDRLITDEGPEVYCTNEVECQHFLRMSKGMVDGGLLDENFLPMCAGDGELRIDNKNVTDKRCDKLSGNFKYTVDGEEKDITENTKFECFYKPKIVNNQQNQANKEKIRDGGLIGGGVCVGVVILVCLVGAGWMYISAKMDERKIMQPQANDYKRYAMNSGEKQAEELKNNKGVKNKQQQKQQKPQPSSSEKPQPIDRWNDMIQWIRHNSVKTMGAPTSDHHGEIEKDIDVDNSDEAFKVQSPIHKWSDQTKSCKRSGSDANEGHRKFNDTVHLKEVYLEKRQERIDKENSKNKKK